MQIAVIPLHYDSIFKLTEQLNAIDSIEVETNLVLLENQLNSIMKILGKELISKSLTIELSLVEPKLNLEYQRKIVNPCKMIENSLGSWMRHVGPNLETAAEKDWVLTATLCRFIVHKDQNPVEKWSVEVKLASSRQT